MSYGSVGSPEYGMPAILGKVFSLPTTPKDEKMGAFIYRNDHEFHECGMTNANIF